MSKPGPHPIIKTHPQRREIDEAIVSLVSNREIARRYGVSEKAVRTYIASSFAENLTRAMKERELTDGMFVLNQMMELLTDLKKMRTALIEWLADPDDPEKLSVDPRAWEVDIVYSILGPNGGVIQKKKTLQDMISIIDRFYTEKMEIEYPGFMRERIHWKAVDNRQLLLNTINSTTGQLMLWLKSQENAKDVHMEAAMGEIIRILLPMLLESAGEHPEFRLQLESTLERFAKRVEEVL